MSTQPPSEDPTQQYSQPQGQPPEGGGSNPWPWVLGAIAIVVAGVLAAIVITGGNDSSSNTASSASTPVTTVKTKTTTSVPTTTQTQTTTAPPSNINNTCNVSQVPNTDSGTTVATVVATNVPSSQKYLADCAQASSLVRGVARQQVEMPTNVQGFACTPSVKGSYVSYKCTMNGADSPMQINTKFSLTYSN